MGYFCQLSNQILEIGRRFTLDRDALARAGMNKTKIGSMEGDAGNQLLRRFRRVVFSIADERMAHGRKLRPDLILQSGHQLNPDERSLRKKAFDGIAKFGTGCPGVFRTAQLLEHALTPKVVHERSRLGIHTATQHREIVPYRTVVEKLTHEPRTIRIGLGKQQNAGGKPIDAMHHQGALSLSLEFGDEQRQSGRGIGAFNRHRQESGWFVDHDHRIVFVKHGQLPRETGWPPVFADRNPIRLLLTAASFSRKSLHGQRHLGNQFDTISMPLRKSGTNHGFAVQWREKFTMMVSLLDCVSRGMGS